ncbi:MAG: hypothetical protein OXF79_00080 [Chloroflexi bacterium]|nr:hypothetical protein [Chloroflexota bacterium]
MPGIAHGDGVRHGARQDGPDKLDAFGFHPGTEERYLQALDMAR